MSAPLVSHWTREPFPAHMEIHVLNNGDVTVVAHQVNRMTRPAGQLWERVAEAAEVSELGRDLSKRGDL